jgi:hypothetical protein
MVRLVCIRESNERSIVVYDDEGWWRDVVKK